MKKLALIAFATTLPLLGSAASFANLSTGTTYDISYSGAGNLVAQQQIGFEVTSILPKQIDGSEQYSLNGTPNNTQVSYSFLPEGLTENQQYAKLATAPGCLIRFGFNPDAQPNTKEKWRVSVQPMQGGTCSIAKDGSIDMS